MKTFIIRILLIGFLSVIGATVLMSFNIDELTFNLTVFHIINNHH